MVNSNHLKILKKGSDEWNRWREENPSIELDLFEADLRGLDLTDANLLDVKFKRANLNGVDCKSSLLSRAYLYEAELGRVF